MTTNAIPAGTVVSYLGAKYPISGTADSKDGKLVGIALFENQPVLTDRFDGLDVARKEEFGAKAMLATAEALGLTYLPYVKDKIQ